MSRFERIPAELRARDQWVVWRAVERAGKTTKVPYRADGSGRASSTNASTWTTFDAALAAAGEIEADGVGFVFSEDDPYFGVDLDEELSEGDRAAIVLAIDTYTEFSVSGKGMHIIGRGRLENGRHPLGLGVFDRGRYFVMTGQHVRGAPDTIEDRQAQLDEVLAEFLPAHHAGVLDVDVRPVDLPDRELLERAFAARNGGAFRALYDGAWEHRYPSRSEADLALCTHLAFWTARDPGRIDALFRGSGLYREKWRREDYAARTIERAISSARETYSPTQPGLGRVSDAVDSLGASQGVRRGYFAAAPPLKGAAAPGASLRAVSTTGPSHDSVADSVGELDRPFALPVREFVELEREQREPLLADADGRAVIGFRSLVLVGALGGHGKTTWSIDLLLHLAAGVDYPPFTVPRPVPILLIENEGPEQLFADKLAARLKHFPHELKARLDVCTFDWGGFSLADAAHRDRLTREIAEKGYELVFGDPLDSLGIEGVGSPEDTRRFLALMKQTGLNTSVAWWLNTHPRKEETKEALNEIAGAWGGKPDSVFLLRMLEDDRTQIRQPKLRWARRGKGPTLLFAFDPDTEAFSFLGEQADEERDYLAEVRGLLADGDWRTVREISAPAAAGGIAANDKVVQRALEEHPDVFEMRSGDGARALGRSPQARLWQLAGEHEEAPA